MTQLKDKLTEYLVAEAAKTQKNGASLTAVFKKTGEKFSLATGSVRNYYYSLIKKARTDDELKQKYPFISSLNARKKRRFTFEEEQELIKNVKDGVKNGKSVRRVIYELSQGDEKLALRLQNKYRSVNSSKKSRKNEASPYERLCEAIDSLIERIKEKYRDLGVIEAEVLRAEIKKLKGERKESKAVAYFKKPTLKSRKENG